MVGVDCIKDRVPILLLQQGVKDGGLFHELNHFIVCSESFDKLIFCEKTVTVNICKYLLLELGWFTISCRTHAFTDKVEDFTDMLVFKLSLHEREELIERYSRCIVCVKRFKGCFKVSSSLQEH